jgi:hypothetical protein
MTNERTEDQHKNDDENTALPPEANDPAGGESEPGHDPSVTALGKRLIDDQETSTSMKQSGESGSSDRNQQGNPQQTEQRGQDQDGTQQRH